MEAIEEKETSGVRYHTKIKIKCDSNFRNEQGQFDTHVFEVFLWQGVCKRVQSCLTEKQEVAIKGRLDQLNGNLVIVAEQIELFSN